MAKHNEVGKIGEEIACKYLKNNGFSVIERNFRVYYGEIDIIVKKDKKIHFIEVKTVSLENIGIEEGIRPEENMHEKKIERLNRAIEIYLSEKRMEDISWSLQLLTVKYSAIQKKAKVSLMEII